MRDTAIITTRVIVAHSAHVIDSSLSAQPPPIRYLLERRLPPPSNRPCIKIPCPQKVGTKINKTILLGIVAYLISGGSGRGIDAPLTAFYGAPAAFFGVRSCIAGPQRRINDPKLEIFTAANPAPPAGVGCGVDVLS